MKKIKALTVLIISTLLFTLCSCTVSTIAMLSNSNISIFENRESATFSEPVTESIDFTTYCE